MMKEKIELTSIEILPSSLDDYYEIRLSWSNGRHQSVPINKLQADYVDQSLKNLVDLIQLDSCAGEI